MASAKPVAVVARKRTTGIEWTEHTWNPFVGCTVKSAGCFNCYAMSLANRLAKMGQKNYEGLTAIRRGKVYWTGELARGSDSAWNKPRKIKNPSIIFVNSMSDFWHEKAPDDWRHEALALMADTPHQYQVLTKRPEELLLFIKRQPPGFAFPDNVWLGATVEDSKTVFRIDLLRDVPAKIKFLSVEPLIAATGKLNLAGIDWVITGGESGHGARPMEVDWLRSVRNDCLAQGVPHFFKQFGQPRNNPLWDEAVKNGLSPSAYVEQHDPIGKGGSMLDEVYYKEMPGEFKVAEVDPALAETKA